MAKPWTLHEEIRLSEFKRLFDEGTLAKLLKRTPRALQVRAKQLGLTQKQPNTNVL